ncbi:ABC transporter ATP-binding protein [Marinobacter fuscus]|uniref:ABC transporter ATP-binding protein n=1 Tax=Marinobacter fuscus TaxID=2109942 RepID=A0A2T1KDP4_9GAMM|nr:ABC transporter ATP-binding protein [Marinobacter fuscus]PSF08235.1 ABC transporter ATP-binding protein [Marinobacter fuscus]
MPLVIENLSHRYPGKTALADVSFRLAPGQFNGLLGLNGAGKTTLFGLATRLLAIQRGSIYLQGHSLARPTMAALRGLGVVFQQSTLDLDLTVQQNLAYHASLQGLRPSMARARICQELARFELTDHHNRPVRMLNGGHRRRVELARAMLHQPEVLLLDEPTTGLDVASRSFLVEHVHQLCRKQGLTVLWATHLFDELQASDQALVLHQGRLLANQAAAELIREQQSDNLQSAFEALTQGDSP